MKDEYDFSKAERGKFYRRDAVLVPPVHLDPEVLAFQPDRTRQRPFEEGYRADRGGRIDSARGLVSALRHPGPTGFPAFSRSARNTASAVSGSSVRRTPTASSMALAIAGDRHSVAVSPAPLAPNGPLC